VSPGCFLCFFPPVPNCGFSWVIPMFLPQWPWWCHLLYQYYWSGSFLKLFCSYTPLNVPCFFSLVWPRNFSKMCFLLTCAVYPVFPPVSSLAHGHSEHYVFFLLWPGSSCGGFLILSGYHGHGLIFNPPCPLNKPLPFPNCSSGWLCKWRAFNQSNPCFITSMCYSPVFWSFPVLVVGFWFCFRW